MENYEQKYLKYKTKYLKLKNNVPRYKMHNQLGGATHNNINNIGEYNLFLNNVEQLINEQVVRKNDVEAEKIPMDAYNTFNEDNEFQFMCACFGKIKLILSVEKIIRASNDFYVVNINKEKECMSSNIYIEKANLNKIGLKICDMDKYSCSYGTLNEVSALIKYSKLCINNVCNSFVLFLGFTNNCAIDVGTTGDSIDINDKWQSVILMSYVENSEHINDIDERQLFEYVYAMLCSITNFGFFVTDLHADNCLSFDDDKNVMFKIFDQRIYFSTFKSLCIIDYQAIDHFSDYTNNINISNYIIFIKNYCKQPNVIQRVDKILKTGTINKILESLIEAYSDYTYTGETIPDNTKLLEYQIIV